MQISTVDPLFQNALFISIFLGLVILSAKNDKGPHEMNQTHTNEIKGIAILMVIFSHIGYFLFTDHRFIYPLSIAGGVGVNIFLFLSGFGVTSSAIKDPMSRMQFYKKRLKSIFIPMWLVLALTLAADYFILAKTYPTGDVIRSIFGIFPIADIYTSINSPLWYFTFILFYYFVYPLVFNRNKPFLSIITIFLVSVVVAMIDLPVSNDVLKLYKLHFLAFPLGMIFAYINLNKPGLVIKRKLNELSSSSFVTTLIRYLLVGLCVAIFSCTAVHSGIGKSIFLEQFASTVTVLSIVFIFLLKNTQFDLLVTLGKYSYEIYLIQWPLMYRYDFIYKNTPAFLGTIIYILLFIVIGYLMRRIVKIIVSNKE